MLDSVLIRAAIVNYNSLSGLNNQHAFLTVLEARNSKIKVPAVPVSGENLLPGLQMAIFSLYSYMEVSRERESSSL